MIGIILQMLYLLLAVQHLPALDTQHFPVGLSLYGVEAVNEGVPFRGIALNHLRIVKLGAPLLGRVGG